MKESLLRRVFQYVCGGLLAVGVLLFIPGVVAPVLLFVIRLLFGWMFHAAKAVASIVPTWQGFTAGTATLLATLGALHLLLRMFARRDNTDASPWKLRWSASIMGMLLILFATTCASVGILHHAVWFLKADVLKNRRVSPLRVAKISGKQLAEHLQAYAGSHDGSYPKRLEDLVTTGHVDAAEIGKAIRLQTPGEVPQTWIYLPGLSTPDGDDLPLLISSGPVGGQDHLMITRDGRFAEVSAADAETALKRWRDRPHPALTPAPP